MKTLRTILEVITESLFEVAVLSTGFILGGAALIVSIVVPFMAAVACILVGGAWAYEAMFLQ